MVDIKCPIEPCGAKWKMDREHSLERLRKDIQHHLYMRHRVQVIESHKLARETIEKEKQNGRTA